MYPFKKNYANVHHNLLPVHMIQRMPAGPSVANETRVPLQELPNTRVPNVQATAARLLHNSSFYTPDIKRTAARLQSAKVAQTPDHCTQIIMTTDKSTAENPHYEDMTFFIPEIKTMARDLRLCAETSTPEQMLRVNEDSSQYAEASDSMMKQDLFSAECIPIVEEYVLETDKNALELTEVEQVSFCSTGAQAVDIEQHECRVCARICEQEIKALALSRKQGRRSRIVCGNQAKKIVMNVYKFFKELNAKLRRTCAASVFKAPRDITTLACGISRGALSSMNKTAGEVAKRKTRSYSRKSVIMATLKKHGPEWGETVRQAIHQKLRREEDITIAELHAQLSAVYENFRLSLTTLYRLVKGLDFAFVINRNQGFIFEKADLIGKRLSFLQAMASARESEDYIIYMDETWVFSGMTKKRGWNDKSIPQFAPRSTLEKYSCGRTACKNKGQRAIVISALTKDGVIPESTKVVVSGMRDLDGDYHNDMDHEFFENWLAESLPHMLRWARGKRVTLIIDNAPYHSRQLEKIPTTSSTKKQIKDFLISKEIETEERATKAELLQELHEYVQSKGGYSALRRYATEQICERFGVNLIRLPPYHCCFNAIELCWSQLKAYLNKHGKTIDKIDLVKHRTVSWLANVPSSLAEAWFQDAKKKESEAWEKYIMDREEDNETQSSTSDSATEYDSDEEIEHEDDEVIEYDSDDLYFQSSYLSESQDPYESDE